MNKQLILLDNSKENGESIFYLSRIGNLEKVKIFLSYTNPNIEDHEGKSPLHHACMAHPNCDEISNNLYEDLKENKRKIAKLLINSGAEVNKECNRGFTPIKYAKFHSEDKLLVELIEKHSGIENIIEKKTNPKRRVMFSEENQVYIYKKNATVKKEENKIEMCTIL